MVRVLALLIAAFLAVPIQAAPIWYYYNESVPFTQGMHPLQLGTMVTVFGGGPASSTYNLTPLSIGTHTLTPAPNLSVNRTIRIDFTLGGALTRFELPFLKPAGATADRLDLAVYDLEFEHIDFGFGPYSRAIIKYEFIAHVPEPAAILLGLIALCSVAPRWRR